MDGTRTRNGVSLPIDNRHLSAQTSVNSRRKGKDLGTESTTAIKVIADRIRTCSLVEITVTLRPKGQGYENGDAGNQYRRSLPPGCRVGIEPTTSLPQEDNRSQFGPFLPTEVETYGQVTRERKYSALPTELPTP